MPPEDSAATTAAPAAPQALPPGRTLPDVPQKLTLAEEFDRALTDAGMRSRETAPKGARRVERPGHGKAASTTEPAAAGKEGTSAAAVTQPSLSAGFAKLTRQQRAADKREAALVAREEAIAAEAARIEHERGSVGEARKAWEKEQAAKLEELSLLDSDEVTWIERYAARRGTTPQAVYDKLMRRVLNDGVVHPADVADELKTKVQELQAKVDGDAEERKRREAEAAHQERVRGEQAAFVQYVTATDAAKYPLLAKEPAADIAAVGYSLASDYFKRTGKPANLEMVAAHLEKQLQDERDLEELRAKRAGAPTAGATAASETASEEDEEDDDPAPARASAAAPRVARPEPKGATEVTKPKLRDKSKPAAGPKTLTHKLAAVRSGQPLSRPRDDNERLERALSVWK